MKKIPLSVAEFRLYFPAFKDVEQYPNNFLELMLDTAIIYVPNIANKYNSEKVVKQMDYLMTAHLATIQYGLVNGSGNIAGGVVNSASIDGVSVSKVAPKNKNNLEYWLNQTIYGQQLLALLSSQSAVGIYFGGQKENVFR